MEGYIPNITVNITKIKSIEYSLLFKSGRYTYQPLNIPPKIILLNIKIVYTADKIIEEEANIPARDNLSNIPYKDINSPTKFKVRGAPQLPKQSIKNNIEKIGIICANPP